MKLLILQSFYCLNGGNTNDITQTNHTRVKIMLMEECDKCKHLVRLIGLGLGARCTHSDNQKYKLKEDNQNMPVIISRIPSDCKLKEVRQC